MHAAQTFLWHDYETFGTRPSRDRPAQFAAIRTDLDLNEIGEPIELYCQPPTDMLPEIEACLITGITPQRCESRGVNEAAFAARIQAEMSAPGTISLGYNSIRFDDEVTRYLLWRNLRDPFAREWRNGCSRWDLLDVVRCAYALRPQGIEWPLVDGQPSFKLEHLTRANGLVHDAAHDAVSDVRATIALARLLKQQQPKLFEFCLALRHKQRVAQELGLPTTVGEARPFLHVSGMFSPTRGCLAVMWPLAMHPTNANELLAWDLREDPAGLADLTAEQLRERLFTPTQDLPEGVSRLPIKGIHLNKSPIVIRNLRTLSDAQAQRWGVDLAQAERHAQQLRGLPDMTHVWRRVYERPAMAPRDVDEDLYGGFLSDSDRDRLVQFIELSPEAMSRARLGFDDPRLQELVFRFRARNFPESLSADEVQTWQAHREARVLHGEDGYTSVQAFWDALESRLEAAEDDEASSELLSELYDWGDHLANLGQ
ncbi:exodeoxyribonuclease I [Comamonas serinivorans]|uniref:Exodeoxyribonuclease I n=1 Tax=Comamonas serinivorans TaxID=1082851 RepID=A0A1Y0ENP4_9BURK|nr:exodeoxyribonuclease I [Comamonas serinivorans]ARU05031.1 exodeoxyribonuclease I [Comamonas serinivorans]